MLSKNNHRCFHKLLQDHCRHHYHFYHHRCYRSIMMFNRLIIMLIIMYSIVLMAQSRTLVSDPISNTNYFRNLLSNGIGFNKTILFEREEVTSDIVKILRENPDKLLANRTDNLKLFK